MNNQYATAQEEMYDIIELPEGIRQFNELGYSTIPDHHVDAPQLPPRNANVCGKTKQTPADQSNVKWTSNEEEYIEMVADPNMQRTM